MLFRSVTGGEIASTFDRPDLSTLGECDLIDEIMVRTSSILYIASVKVFVRNAAKIPPSLSLPLSLSASLSASLSLSLSLFHSLSLTLFPSLCLSLCLSLSLSIYLSI